MNIQSNSRRADWFSIAVTLLVIFNLLSYQLWPVFSVNAEEEAVSAETTESPADNSDSSSAADTSEEPAPEETPAAVENNETPACDPCEPDTVNSTNETTAENTATSDANTGDNGIGTLPEETPTDPTVTEETPAVAGDTGTGETAVEGEAAATVEPDPSLVDLLPADAPAEVQEAVADAEEQMQTPLPENTLPIDQAANPGSGGDNDSNDNDDSQNTAESTPACGGEVNPCPETPTGSNILTGDALSVSDILNDININIVGEGERDVVVIDGNQDGDINLLEQFLALIKANEQAMGSLDVSNTNVADVINNAIANSNSGNNYIAADGTCDGHACYRADGSVIETGDAIASANIVNFINQNIVGNNWLFSVINVLGNWSGNLIVPGEGVLNLLPSLGWRSLDVTNTNTAEVENNVTAVANTGGNTLTSSYGPGAITTGDAVSSTDVTNVVNTNMVGNNWFFLMINNMGNWTGNIIGWNGLLGAYQNMFSFNFGSLGGEEAGAGTLTVNNTNIANVENNATATANTGGNTLLGKGSITTGNAGAFANIFNMINSNFVGSNWMFGIVNIMGNWTGNVEFAYPDLAVSISDGKDDVQPGEVVSYAVHYSNHGKAPCEGTTVSVALPAGVSYQSDNAGSSPTVSGNVVTWKMPALSTGESRTLALSAKVDLNLTNDTKLETQAAASASNNEKELGDNIAGDSSRVKSLPVKITLTDEDITDPFDSKLKIERRSNISGQVSPGNIIKHQIIVKNGGEGPIQDVAVRDMLKDAQGELMSYIWPVGTIKEGEGYMIEYEVAINNPGRVEAFENVAEAQGIDANNEQVESREVSNRLTILGFIPAAQASEPGEAVIPEITTDESSEAGNVLGASSNKPSLNWLWLLTMLPAGYIVRRKELYKWQNIQQYAKAASGFFSSWL